ncbi:primase C-terminal domain-containing protein [Hymenobacter pini]|uniref:primase C-terminal domain-containing protein n=1 Tax=Hymenobacter pini TaxID=2880879 RepID=UPI001CF1332C|nr:primase C-terminal domain-containing protein [Hymenobacter pini]MCA8830302.1 primase C-terminal domain-containing protein [Hymenobacter pini]
MNYEIVRGSLTNRGLVQPKHQIELLPTDEEFYLSLFGFDNTIFEHLEVHRDPQTGKSTVAGFAGSYFAEFLYFDLDRDGDLAGSLESARDLVKRLYSRFQLSPKQLYLSFSGSKGFHIGLHQSLFGGFEPSPRLPEFVQILVARLVAECHGLSLSDMQTQHATRKKNREGNFADVDFGIYTPNRLFRVINSRNAKSGRYKIGLTSQELLSLPLEELLTLAEQPRPDYRPECRLTGQTPVPELAQLWEYARTFDAAAFTKAHGTQSGKGTAIDRDFFAPPQPGNRNNDLFRQACHLFDHSELYESHVLQLIAGINHSSHAPLPDAEVRQIVKSAFTRTQRTKGQSGATVLTPEAASGDKVEIWSDWTEEWLDYYTQAPSPMTCLLPDIDADQEMSLKGKLCVLIGSGGTRKSYFLQNVIAQNVLGYGNRFLYSSMEMGKPETVNRFLDMYFDAEDGVPASKVLQRYARDNKDQTRELLRQGSQTVADQLILTSNGGKTVQDYERDIQRTIALYGSLDGLAIDGLSAMGGKGEETERYSRATLELKELAKRYNLFILLICHTTKACAAHTRDARPFVRGSEKILDNSDFSICFANIIDVARSTPDNIHYCSHLAHVKYYNKRGSGKMLNQLLEFDGLRKLFSPSPAPLLNYPDHDAFVREYAKKARQAAKDDDPF